MKYLIYILLLCFFASCDKNDPKPELSDEIYKDYETELDIAKKTLENEEKAHLKLIDEKNKVIPQTGQIKFIQKKVYDSEKWIETLKQQKQFFAIKLEVRKAEVREKYLRSKKGGKPWPDEAELQNYRTTIKLHRDKLAWDKNKGVKKNVPRGTEESKKK